MIIEEISEKWCGSICKVWRSICHRRNGDGFDLDDLTSRRWPYNQPFNDHTRKDEMPSIGFSAGENLSHLFPKQTISANQNKPSPIGQSFYAADGYKVGIVMGDPFAIILPE